MCSAFACAAQMGEFQDLLRRLKFKTWKIQDIGQGTQNLPCRTRFTQWLNDRKETLHTPFSKATKNLIDARRLALLKPQALFINCGRGGLVDEDALLDLAIT